MIGKIYWSVFPYYADLYLEIMLKLESFNKEIMSNSLK